MHFLPNAFLLQGNNQSPGRPYSSNGFINPNSNDNNNNYGSNNNNYGYNDPYNQNNSHSNSQNSNLNSYYPTPNSNPYNPALQNGAPNNNNTLTAYPQQGGGVKYPLNKEFSSVLERGSLEDIARLLESTAPRPEVSALIMLFVLSFSYTFSDIHDFSLTILNRPKFFL